MINQLQQQIIKPIKSINSEIQETREILKQTAKKIKIKEIEVGLLLMAWNLDDLEQLNKLTIK